MSRSLHLPHLHPAPRLDLGAWRDRMPLSPITRFAPSPTGVLHIGHVVHAVFVWGVARAFGGTVILRMEDHDRTRCRPEYERAILDDLEWLGFGADTGFRHDARATASTYRQSDCGAVYEEHLARLREVSAVYACDCSRRTIREEVGADAPGDREVPYPGTCRDRALGMENGRGVRVRLPDQAARFEDVVMGRQEQRPWEQCGDLLILDRRGQWTYQFSVVVDDARHGVTMVIRGSDLLTSTGRQIALYRLLGAPPPRYLHHPLVEDAGRKLSKRYGAAGVAALRTEGFNAAEVIGYAAYLGGVRREASSLAAVDVGDLFAAHAT